MTATVPCCTITTEAKHGKSSLEQSPIRLFSASRPETLSTILRDCRLRSITFRCQPRGSDRLHCEHGPGKHWIALWTQDNVCEILDSFALPLQEYKTTDPLIEWLERHYKVQVYSQKTLQSAFSQSCGD